MDKKRAEIEHLHARMIVFVGCTIAVTFALTVIGFVYGLLFVIYRLAIYPYRFYDRHTKRPCSG